MDLFDVIYKTAQAWYKENNRNNKHKKFQYKANSSSINTEEEQEKLLLPIFQATFKNGNVEFIKQIKTFTYEPKTEEGTIETIKYLSQPIQNKDLNDEKKLLSAWNDVYVPSMKEFSVVIEKAASGCSLAVINPENHEDFVLFIKNGVIVHNSFKSK